MKKNYLILIKLLFITFYISSQNNTCTSDTDLIADLNSITKCSIEESVSGNKKTKKVTIVVQTKRKPREASKNLQLSSNNKIDEFKRNTLLVSKLEIRNKEALKNKLPFSIVEEKPRFKACEALFEVDAEKCFNKELQNHIKNRLNYPRKALWHQMEGKVLVQFMIDKEGNVASIQSKGPKNGKLLEEEAERVIASLPKFSPGKVKGEAVYVNKGVPINFKLPKQYRSASKKYISFAKVLDFEAVDELPKFEKCLNENDGSIDCFNNEIIQHIEANFKYPKQAVEDNIEGNIIAEFIINEKGKITNIQLTAPENAKILERAAERLIEKLPQFTPATKSNKKVKVKYTIPIEFKLS